MKKNTSAKVKNKPANAKNAVVKTARKTASAKNAAVKAVAKPANAARKAVKSVGKPVKTVRNVAKSISKPVKTFRKPAKTINKPAKSVGKPAKTINDAKNGRGKPGRPPRNPDKSLRGDVMAPVPHWRPEYLGKIWVLNRHIPDYMPSGELELLAWIDQYLATAEAYRTTFPAIFNSTGPLNLANLATARWRVSIALQSAAQTDGFHRALLAWKNILLYNRERDPIGAPKPEANMIPAGDPWSAVSGIVGIIDEQVKLLRVHPAFDQKVAEQFGIIPPAPGSVDPTTLDPGGRARILTINASEIQIELRYRGIIGLAGVDGVQISVDRGDGQWHDLTFTQRASFVDTHLLPGKACVWRYRLSFASRLGNTVGRMSMVSVAVQAAS